MRGGLKPTKFGSEINLTDPQDDLEKLKQFIAEMERTGITYPPITLSSEGIHNPNEQLAQETIEYKVKSIVDDRSITLEIKDQGLRPVTAEETMPIKTGTHTEHSYHPYRVFCRINGHNYYIQECMGDSVVFMEDIDAVIKVGELISITRNRAGDFVIYTATPTELRYLDNQLQLDYQKYHNVRVGHLSLLDKPADYSEVVRGDGETDETRASDLILFAGEINWRAEGSAHYYLNAGGRYQPDLDDVDYLAKINPQFDRTIETAKSEETGGEPKLFFRKHDKMSNLVMDCNICDKSTNITDVLKFPYEAFPEKRKGMEMFLWLCPACVEQAKINFSCGSCEACRFGMEDQCFYQDHSYSWWPKNPVSYADWQSRQ